jgi:phosphatidylserine decarboxylase
VFAREGYSIIGVVVFIAVLLVAIAFMLPGALRPVLIVLATVLVGFTLYFFRDPQRIPPDEAAEGLLILAPADGKVVQIIEVEEPLYLKGPARQISIFLSPLNVHVNRVPANGKIEYVNYFKGEYLVAWHPKASEKNERSEIGMLHPSGIKILFKQIAGAVARRIVFDLKPGDVVTAGQRFGIVKFGSRMDVLVPPEVEVIARVGDRVSAGLTVIARLPEETEIGKGNHVKAEHAGERDVA